MRAPTVLLAAFLLAAIPSAPALPREADPDGGTGPGRAGESEVEIVFDHEPVSLLPGLRPTQADVRAALHVQPVRVPLEHEARVVPLPVAWRLEAVEAMAPPALPEPQGRLVIDAEATRRLGAALSGLELGGLLAAALREAAPGVGAALEPADEAAVLVLHRAPHGRAHAQSATASIRALLRGCPGEDWALTGAREAEAEGDPTAVTAAAALPATLPSGAARPRFVLQLDLLSLGLHLEGSSYPMTQRLLHATVRARLWDLDLAQRAWQRDVMAGVELPPDGADGVPTSLHAVPAAARTIVAEAVRRSLEPLWGTDPVRDPTGDRRMRTERPAGDLASVVAPPGPAPSLDEALHRLARRRRAPAGPDAWTALARSVRLEVDDDLGLVLNVAEDPVGALVEVGSARLGLGLAETHRRVESSAAFRRALSNDLVAEVAQRRPAEPWLAEATRRLLAPVGGATEAVPTEPAGRDLLERAAPDGTVTADSLALLLVAARLWPEGSADLAARWAGPDPSSATY